MTIALASISSLPAGALALYLVSLLLPLSWWESDAIGRAEAFILRNGYTAAGHPPDLPVLVNDIMDNVSSANDLAEMRRGMLEPRAIGIVGVKGFGYDVLFKYARPELQGLNDLDSYFVVSVGADGEAHTQHVMPQYPEWFYKAIPR